LVLLSTAARAGQFPVSAAYGTPPACVPKVAFRLSKRAMT
jgi:hypothetical protein